MHWLQLFMWASDPTKVQVMNLLVNWACQCEAILSADAEEDLDEENQEYLQQKLLYRDSVLLDEKNEAVMMEWEKPIMLAHANLICQSGGDILNIGFGLGLIDDAIQQYVILSKSSKSCAYVMSMHVPVLS